MFKNIQLILTLVFTGLISSYCYGTDLIFSITHPRVMWRADFWSAVKQDYSEHYSLTGLTHLGIAVGANGIFANTSLDKNISHHCQSHIRGNTTNDFAKAVDTFTQLRQIRVVIPTYLVAMALGSTLQPWAQPIGKWGEHSIRILLLAAPQQALLTEALGAHRPYQNSRWNFFKGNRSVSGHAFYGAVPLISAAAVSHGWELKTFYYVLSILPALSRINTNKHYFSQAGLGWGLAFLASQSVQRADQNLKNPVNFKLGLQPIEGGLLMGAQIYF